LIIMLFIVLFALHATVAVQMFLLRIREPKNNAALFSGGAFAVYALLFLTYIVVPQEKLESVVLFLVAMYVVLVPILAGVIWHMMRRVFHDEN
jgi:hypothetical protein